MYRTQLFVTFLLVAVYMLLPIQPALASVGLVDFSAVPTANNTILLKWETATEQSTVGFKLYRALTQSGPDWLDLTPDGIPAQGTLQGGARYEFEDAQDVVEGVRYYYQLREVTNTGNLVELQTVSAGVNLPADAPATATATATPTPTTTATRGASAGSVATATRMSAPHDPTATPRFTAGPPTAVPPTLLPQAGATVAPAQPAAPTPLPGAQVATPTGLAPRMTIPPAAAPTATSDSGLSPLPAPADQASPTPVSVAAAPVQTATPVPTRDSTPIIFGSDAQDADSSTPEAAGQAAGQGARSNTQALVIGGSALGLAGLLAAAVLFLRSRRL